MESKCAELMHDINRNISSVQSIILQLQNDVCELFLMKKVYFDKLSTLSDRIEKLEERLAPIERRGSFRLVSNAKE